jgi:hypothetical protein
MTIVVGEMREQTTAKPEADPCGMTNKRTTATAKATATATAKATAKATAGPSTPLLAGARAAPLRMTHHCVGGSEQTTAKARAGWGGD